MSVMITVLGTDRLPTWLLASQGCRRCEAPDRGNAVRNDRPQKSYSGLLASLRDDGRVATSRPDDAHAPGRTWELAGLPANSRWSA
jgi:hypothetical protein